MIILYVIVLILVAMFFIIAEILTPSFGLLAAMALASAAGAIYFCFQVSSAVGYTALVGLGVGLPLFALVAVKVLPRTSLGRRVLLTKELVSPGEGTPSAARLAPLLGKEGVSQTVLRPAGLIRVDGRRIEAQTEGRHVQAGVRVRVVRLGNNFVVVRPIEDAPGTPPGQEHIT
jgi:membrane-bound ClpP family serine protease